jgi:hypothetical protein
VLVIGVPDVGDPRKACGEGLADCVLAGEALTPVIRPARPLEDGVIREVGEDPVQIVPIECRCDLRKHRNRLVVIHRLLRV